MDGGSVFLPNWSYDGSDPGLRLFTLANEKLPSVCFDDRTTDIMEVGACDTDFMELAEVASSDLLVWGIDWRKRQKHSDLFQRADFLTCALGRFDAFVALSAIEHIGLGHYDMDPLDPYGDIKAVQRMREHVVGGGFIYFDVPYAPEGYYVMGTKCRVYDDQALRERFGPHEVLGYTLPSVTGWIEKPTRNCDAPKPYYYVACLIGN